MERFHKTTCWNLFLTILCSVFGYVVIYFKMTSDLKHESRQDIHFVTLKTLKHQNAINKVLDNSNIDLKGEREKHINSTIHQPNYMVESRHVDTHSEQGVHLQGNIVKINTTDVQKVLLFTHYRSGSSFVGEILKHNRDTFYMFEPLMFLSLNQKRLPIVRDVFLSRNLSHYLSHFFMCNFTYINQVSTKHLHRDRDNKTRQFWVKVAFPKMATFQEAEKECLTKAHVTAKIIRAQHLRDTFNFMTERNNVIVNLVRDPRGMFTSRVQLVQKLHKQGSSFEEIYKNQDVETHCKNLVDNYMYMTWLTHNASSVANKLVVIRYEDFAYQPIDMAAKLYSFLNFKEPKHFEKWILDLTKPASSNHTRAGQIYGVKKNSSKIAESWRQVMPFELVLEVQNYCRQALDIYGYQAIDTQEELRNTSLSLVNALRSDIPQL